MRLGFIPTDIQKIPTVLLQLILTIMSITTDNDQVSVYANSLPFLPSCQIIGKHIGIGHQESAIIDYLYWPRKFLIVFSQ